MHRGWASSLCAPTVCAVTLPRPPVSKEYVGLRHDHLRRKTVGARSVALVNVPAGTSGPTLERLTTYVRGAPVHVWV
jgi:hypothetical protein